MWPSILCATVRRIASFKGSNPLNTSTDPGPKIAAATGLFFYTIMIRGEEVAWETEMHRKYGEVVRIGPDRLSFITPQAWKDNAGPGAGRRLENSKDSSTLGPDLHGVRILGLQ